MLDTEREQIEACLKKADQIISQYNAMVLGQATQYVRTFCEENDFKTKHLSVVRAHDYSQIIIKDGDKVVSQFIMKEPEDITRIKAMSAQIRVVLGGKCEEP